MGQIQLPEKTEENIQNALQYAKKNEISGPFLAKAAIALGGAKFLAGFIGIPFFFIAGAIYFAANKLIDNLFYLYYSQKESFFILRPETTIVDGKLGLKTVSYDLLPESFNIVFKNEGHFLGMGEREFLEYNNEVIIDYYRSEKDNLYRHLVDNLILLPLKKKMKKKKLTVNPTIIDLYYGMKYDYSERGQNSDPLKSYWNVIDGIATLVSPDYKETIKTLTGVDLNFPEREPKEDEEIYLPPMQLHKAISKLPYDMLSFFIPGFASYEEFSDENASKEYFDLGVKDLVKNAYLSRMVLKYFDKYTDENELEFRRFTEICAEAKENFSDNKVLVRVVEYASIIEKKAEDVEEILKDYRKNPSRYSARDTELLQLKLDSMIEQSKKN